MTKAETASLRISKRAVALVREIATAEGCTPRQYLEALLHYGGSCHKRPGSWEASHPFGAVKSTRLRTCQASGRSAECLLSANM